MIFNPLCMRCNKNYATVKLTKIVGGKVKEINLCKECASEVSPYQKKLTESQANLADILQKLISGSATVKGEEAEPAPREETVKATCSRCRTTFEQYRSSLFLGCTECYEAFEKHLIPELRRLHGSVQHTGKIPYHQRERFERQKMINKIQRELEKSIEDEQFERAAELRDKIRALQEEVER